MASDDYEASGGGTYDRRWTFRNNNPLMPFGTKTKDSGGMLDAIRNMYGGGAQQGDRAYWDNPLYEPTPEPEERQPEAEATPTPVSVKTTPEPEPEIEPVATAPQPVEVQTPAPVTPQPTGKKSPFSRHVDRGTTDEETSPFYTPVVPNRATEERPGQVGDAYRPQISGNQFMEGVTNLFSPLANLGVRPAEAAPEVPAGSPTPAPREANPEYLAMLRNNPYMGMSSYDEFADNMANYYTPEGTPKGSDNPTGNLWDRYVWDSDWLNDATKVFDEGAPLEGVYNLFFDREELNDDFKHFLGKAGQSVINGYNDDQDLSAWMDSQLDGLTFRTPQERYDYENALVDQYYQGLEDGTIERRTDLVTSPEVEEGIENVISDVGGAIGTAVDWVRDNSTQNYDVYDKAAEKYAPGSEEYYEEVNRQLAEQTPVPTPETEPTAPENTYNPFANMSSYDEYGDRIYRAEYYAEQDPTIRNAEAQGNTELADRLRRDYVMLEEYGLNPKQIAREMERRADMALNPLSRVMDANGNYQFDWVTAMNGSLPADQAIPGFMADGNPNGALLEILQNGQYFDENDMALVRRPDGTFVYPDGTPYKGAEPTATYKYTPDQILGLYADPTGDGTFRGLDEMMDKLSPEEQAGMKELIADFIGGGDPNRIREGFEQEFANLTQAEYERLAQLFYDNMPALQMLVEAGAISERDIANFFFKALNNDGTKKPGSTGKGNGYGNGRYYGGGGGGYSGGGGGGYSPTPSATNQKTNRIYNIMKNWSF